MKKVTLIIITYKPEPYKEIEPCEKPEHGKKVELNKIIEPCKIPKICVIPEPCEKLKPCETAETCKIIEPCEKVETCEKLEILEESKPCEIIKTCENPEPREKTKKCEKPEPWEEPEPCKKPKMSFTLDLTTFTPEALEIAKDELRETPENVKTGLEELRTLLNNDDSIYFKDDDLTLTIFLRPCKWYPKSAYELMKRVAEFREKYKDVLANLMPEDEKNAFLNENIINVLKDRDHKGRRVLIVNTGAIWDPSKVTADQMFRLFYLIHEAAVLEPESQIRGVVVIMDYEGLGMKQVRALSPSFSMKLLGFIQDAMPLRLKEVHMVKQPFVFNMVWTLFKPFIREKLKNRIFFHGSKMSSLHKHLEPSHLPADYDGKLPKIDYTAKSWWPCIENHQEHFQEWSKFGLVKK